MRLKDWGWLFWHSQIFENVSKNKSNIFKCNYILVIQRRGIINKTMRWILSPNKSYRTTVMKAMLESSEVVVTYLLSIFWHSKFRIGRTHSCFPCSRNLYSRSPIQNSTCPAGGTPTGTVSIRHRLRETTGLLVLLNTRG